MQLETNRQRTVVLLSGETIDGEQLHSYIGQLPTNAVVQRAELVSLQSDAGAKGTTGNKTSSQFQARVVIRPPLIQSVERSAPRTETAQRTIYGTNP